MSETAYIGIRDDKVFGITMSAEDAAGWITQGAQAVQRVPVEIARACLFEAWPLLSEKEALAEFVRDLIRETSWCGDDLVGSDLQEKAQALGFLKTVPFDPSIHIGPEAWHMSPGDEWTVFAGPLDNPNGAEVA